MSRSGPVEDAPEPFELLKYRDAVENIKSKFLGIIIIAFSPEATMGKPNAADTGTSVLQRWNWHVMKPSRA